MAKNNDSVINNKTISLINQNLIINGELTSVSGTVEILGNVEGDININSLTIHETGKVNGNVLCKILVLKGSICGNVSGDTIRVKSTGVVNGDIQYDILSIEDGASLNGSCTKKQNGDKR